MASIPNVTGVSTSVALDSGFVSALKSLDVAPSPSGKATVNNGVATFPITGGHITVYKPGEVNPYVQGILMHEGSGLKLTKGNTVVTLENFVIDPGNPATLAGKVLANGNVLADAPRCSISTDQLCSRSPPTPRPIRPRSRVRRSNCPTVRQPHATRRSALTPLRAERRSVSPRSL